MITASRLPEVPLCVDLDGTLIAADSLHESLFELLRSRPLACAGLPFHVLRGRAAFKRTVAGLITLDARKLPYRQDLISFLRDEKSKGRPLLLVTAADRCIADLVAAHLGLFEHVIASDGESNFKGTEKVRAIRAFLGSSEFDYAGDSRADLPVFAAARKTILVYPSARTRRLAEATSRIERIFDGTNPATICD